MSELRLNPLTDEWVIISAARSQRPHAAPVRAARLAQPRFAADCPFCPGNESETAVECEREETGDGWLTRTVLNRYPVLTLADAVPSPRQDGMKVSLTGHGNHEVVIETPRHDLSLALQPVGQVLAVLRTLRRRYRANAALPGIAHITLFKNHGEGAGTSLVHPHAQLVASPIVPSQVRRRQAVYQAYQDRGVSCPVCAVLDDELRDGVRVLHEGPHFAAFIPFAALSAYHIWIIPKRHFGSFGDSGDAELADLAGALRVVLRQLHFGLDDPDYNAVLRSAPLAEVDGHWYLAIVPRLGRTAGFELGSGMFVNPVLPEAAAATLRAAPIVEGGPATT